MGDGNARIMHEHAVAAQQINLQVRAARAGLPPRTIG
jgi:hypothetical protein